MTHFEILQIDFVIRFSFFCKTEKLSQQGRYQLIKNKCLILEVSAKRHYKDFYHVCHPELN